MDTIALYGLSCPLLIAMVVIAATLLTWRDAVEARARQELRPVEERVQSLVEHANFTVVQLERLIERTAGMDEKPKWIPAMIDFYRRQGQLAADPTSTTEAALALAEEAAQLEREQPVQGFARYNDARELATLLQMRTQQSS